MRELEDAGYGTERDVRRGRVANADEPPGEGRVGSRDAAFHRPCSRRAGGLLCGGRRWNPDVRLRLARTAPSSVPELAESPEPGDEAIDVGSITVFVEPGVEGVVDAGEHNVLTIDRG